MSMNSFPESMNNTRELTHLIFTLSTKTLAGMSLDWLEGAVGKV